MSQDDRGDGSNLRSERYILARTRCRCGSCRAETRVVALVLPPGHELLTLDVSEARAESAGRDGAQTERHGEGSVERWASSEHLWERAPSPAFLFHVESLPASVRDRLAAALPGYRHTTCGAMSYYANHCEACGRTFDDQELFCEPEGAFQPVNEIAAAAIVLTAIEEPVSARAAGYSVAPQFFEFMSTG
jgi:hypothetical protein